MNAPHAYGVPIPDLVRAAGRLSETGQPVSKQLYILMMALAPTTNNHPTDQQRTGDETSDESHRKDRRSEGKSARATKPRLPESGPSPRLLDVPHSSQEELTLARQRLRDFAAGLGEEVADWRKRDPVHFPIIADQTFRSVLRAMASSEAPSRRPDVGCAVRRLARARPLGRITYRTRRRVRGGIVLVRDEGEAMMPFVPDMARFSQLAKELIGEDRVEEIALTLDGRLREPKTWPRNGSVIVMSDLHAWARRTARAHPQPRVWRRLADLARTAQMNVSVLVPARSNLTLLRPAYPELFTGVNALAHVVPWAEALTSFHAAARTAGWDRRKLWRQGQQDPSELQGRTRLLAGLLDLVSDVDFHTLRTLRTCISHPVRAGLDYATAPWRIAPLSVLGPADELEVWTADIFSTRGTRARLDQRAVHLAERPARIAPKEWNALRRFAATILARARSGRGFDQLVGDRWRWVISRDDSDALEMRRVYRDVQRDLLTVDGNTDRVTTVFGAPGPSNAIGKITDRGRRLTLTPKDGSIEVGLDAPEATFSFPLAGGETLADIRLEFHPFDAAKEWDQTTTIAFDTLPRRAAIPEDTGYLRLRVGDAVHNLPLADDGRLTQRELSSRPQGEIFVEDESVIVGDRRYSLPDLADLGPSSSPAPINLEDHDPTTDRRQGSLFSFRDSRYQLSAQRSSASTELHSIALPGALLKWSIRITAAGPGGAVSIGGDDLYFASDCPGTDHAAVASWSVLDLQRQPALAKIFHQLRLAASSSGAALLIPRQNRSACYFFPRPEPDVDRDAQPPPTHRVIEGKVDKVALDESGRLIVSSGKNLIVFSPDYPQLGVASKLGGASSGFEEAVEDEFPAFIFEPRPSELGRWFARETFARDSLVDHLVSKRPGNLVGIYFLLPQAGATLRIEDLQAPPFELEEGAARAFAGTMGDIAEFRSILPSLAASALDARIPGSGLTPLHIATSQLDRSDHVRALLDAGAPPDPRDAFGRTPLMMAGALNDGGEGARRLLDAGADPTATCMVRGRMVGPLASVLMVFDRIENKVAPEIIHRMLEAGASICTWNFSGHRNTLVAAASYGDDAIFDRVLAAWRAEATVPLNETDQEGWSALSVAIWKGFDHAIEALLNAGASLRSGLRGNALAYSAMISRPAIVDILVHGLAVETEADRSTLLAGAMAETRNRANGLKPPNDDEPAEVIAHHRELADNFAEILRILLCAGAEIDADPWPLSTWLASFTPEMPLNDQFAKALFAAADRVIFLETATANGSSRAFETRVLLDDPVISEKVDWTAVSTAGLTAQHLFAAHWRPPPETGQVSPPFADLADRGADPAARDAHGFTPLHYAAAFGVAPSVAALMAMVPETANTPADDGRLPGDLWPSGPTELPRAASPGAVRPPSPREQQSLSFLPRSTEWSTAPFDSDVRTAGAGNGPTTPLSPSDGRWILAQRRRAPLPYSDPTIIEENWWRHENGALAVSGRVLDAEGSEIFTIDGTSPKIHEINAARRVRLETEDDVRNYLIFFCAAVHGEDGAFTIVEDKRMLNRLMASDANVEIETFINILEQDPWRVEAVVCYGTTFFSATFQIQASGMIEMLDDDPIAADAALAYRMEREIFSRRKDPST